jgi:hypothetical protein
LLPSRRALPRLESRPWRPTHLIEAQGIRWALRRAAYRRLAGERPDSVLWFRQAFPALLYGAEPTSSGTLSFSSLSRMTSCARVTRRCDHSHKLRSRMQKIPIRIAQCEWGQCCERAMERHPCNCYTHSRAPFFQIQMYPTIRMPRKISISSSPNRPSSLNCTAQGKRKIVSTSNTTNRMATM